MISRLRHACLLLLLLESLTACSKTGLALGGASALGVAASQERGFATAVQDEAIWLDIKARLFAADVSLFADVKAEVHEKRVLLTGDVPTAEARVEALRLTWEVPGVEKVINELEVRDDEGLLAVARDSWITVQLESRLLLDSEVDELNYAIETVNQTVFLLGIARNPAELDRVIGWAKSLPYVRQVVSYVRVKGTPFVETGTA